MSSKLDKADAQEWLESLQQVGEGWYRQVALAAKAGAPKALGMTRREFAQSIGQKMVDPRQAIIELHKEGHTVEAIADILGVSKDRTVSRILAEEGLIEWTPGTVRRALEQGYDAPRLDETEEELEPSLAETEALHDEIDRLTTQLQGAEAKRKRETSDLKKKLADLRKSVTEEKRRLKREAESLMTKEARDRAEKEAEAWAEEQGRKVLAGLSYLVTNSIVSNLEEAAQELRLLIEQDAITAEGIADIEDAHAGFQDEFNVARMSAGVA